MVGILDFPVSTYFRWSAAMMTPASAIIRPMAAITTAIRCQMNFLRSYSASSGGRPMEPGIALPSDPIKSLRLILRSLSPMLSSPAIGREDDTRQPVSHVYKPPPRGGEYVLGPSCLPG